MKKINLFLCSALLLSVSFFSSCTKDTSTDSPAISFTNGTESTTVTSGNSWTITGNIASVTGLDNVKYFTVVGSSETQLGSAVTSFDDKNNFNFTVTVTNITQSMALKVTATDKNDVTASKTYTITVGAAGAKVAFWTGSLKLGAQSSSFGSSFSTSDGQVYSKTQAKSYSDIVDFIYYYGGSVNAQIMSPNFAGQTGNYTDYVSGWNTLNATKFGTSVSVITSAAFDAITTTDDSPITTAATGLTEDRIGNLASGSIFAFKTADGFLGLVKVTDFVTGTSGSITISVKVQN